MALFDGATGGLKCGLIAFVLVVGVAAARDWYVNPGTGNDAAAGTIDAPVRLAQAAVDRARPGDVIHLLPPGTVYRQTIVIEGTRKLTIEGNDVTLTGADPLPEEGWEQLDGGLRRLQLPRHRLEWMKNRALVVFDGRGVRMGRSPTVRKDFPPLETIGPGEFAWEPVDDARGYLYISGEPSEDEWAVRAAGITTLGTNRDLTIRNLNARHMLNDGFNIHGDCRGLRCENIAAYENYDEGFSAHDTSEAVVVAGRFRGNDNAVFDINRSETAYENCVFSNSISKEVGFAGKRHRLTDCRIAASAPVAVMIKGHRKEDLPCRIDSTVIAGTATASRASVLVQKRTAHFVDCNLYRVDLVNRRGSIRTKDTRLDGRRVENGP